MWKVQGQLAAGHHPLAAGTLLLLLLLLGAGSQRDNRALGNTGDPATLTPSVPSVNGPTPTTPNATYTYVTSAAAAPPQSDDQDEESCPAAGDSLPTDAALGQRSRAALRGCPAVVEFSVSSTEPSGSGADGGPQSLCASVALVNNGQAETLGWQLVWSFVDSRMGVSAVSGAALVPNSGSGSPNRIVNGYDSASVPANGGVTSLTLLLGAHDPAAQPNASSSPGSSGNTAADLFPQPSQPLLLDLRDVSFNGLTCTKLPSSSFLLRDCASPLPPSPAPASPPNASAESPSSTPTATSSSDLAQAATGGDSTAPDPLGATGANASNAPTPAAAHAAPTRLPLCVSVFCCSDASKARVQSPDSAHTPPLAAWGFVPTAVQDPGSFTEIQQALSQLAQTVDLKGLPQSLLTLKDMISAQMQAASVNSSTRNVTSNNSSSSSNSSSGSNTSSNGGNSSSVSNSRNSSSSNGTSDGDNVVRYIGVAQINSSNMSNMSNGSLQAATPWQDLPAVRGATGPPDDFPSDSQPPEVSDAAQPATASNAGQQGTSPSGSAQPLPPLDSGPSAGSSAGTDTWDDDAATANRGTAGGKSPAAPIAVIVPSAVGAAVLVLVIAGIAVARQRRALRLATHPSPADSPPRARAGSTEPLAAGAGAWTPGRSCLLPPSSHPGTGGQGVMSPSAASAVSWLPDLQGLVSSTAAGGPVRIDPGGQAQRIASGPPNRALAAGAHPGGGGAQALGWPASQPATRSSSSSRTSDGSLQMVGRSWGDGSWADEEKGLSHAGSRSSLHSNHGSRAGEEGRLARPQQGAAMGWGEGSGAGEVWRSNLLSTSSCQLFGPARAVAGSAPELPGPWGLFRTATAPERQGRVERLTTLQRGQLAWERRAAAAAGSSEAAGSGGQATVRAPSSASSPDRTTGAAPEQPRQGGGYVPPFRAAGAAAQQGGCGYVPPIRPVAGRRSHMDEAVVAPGTLRVHSSGVAGGQLSSELRKQLLTLQAPRALGPAVREVRTLSDPRPLLHPDGDRAGQGSGGSRGEGGGGSRQVTGRVTQVVRRLEPRGSCSHLGSLGASGGGGGGGGEVGGGAGSPLAGGGDGVGLRAPFVDFKPSDLELLSKLGSGAFGTVHKARITGRAASAAAAACLQVNEQGAAGEVGLLVAVKMVPVMCDAETYDGKSLQALKQEVQVLSQLSHPRIIQFLGAYLSPPNICIVEELAEGGSLHSRLHGRDRRGVKLHPPLTLEEVLQLGTDVASAMAYLHPQIVHRDLKPQNVLLDRHGRAKLCDFGLVKIKDRTWLSTKSVHAGTTAFMAPEQFDGQSINEKVDVYAFSMLLFECITSTQVWSDLDHPMQIIFHVGVHCRRPQLPDSCPADLAALIRGCWDDDPAARPGFDEVLHRLQVMQARAHPS